jgi:ribosomal protein S18 acetylase RimI-like enzyme
MLGMQTKNFPAINLAQRLGFDYCGYIDHYYPNRDIAIFFTKWVI